MVSVEVYSCSHSFRKWVEKRNRWLFLQRETSVALVKANNDNSRRDCEFRNPHKVTFRVYYLHL